MRERERGREGRERKREREEGGRGKKERGRERERDDVTCRLQRITPKIYTIRHHYYKYNEYSSTHTNRNNLPHTHTIIYIQTSTTSTNGLTTSILTFIYMYIKYDTCTGSIGVNSGSIIISSCKVN